MVDQVVKARCVHGCRKRAPCEERPPGPIRALEVPQNRGHRAPAAGGPWVGDPRTEVGAVAVAAVVPWGVSATMLIQQSRVRVGAELEALAEGVTQRNARMPLGVEPRGLVSLKVATRCRLR